METLKNNNLTLMKKILLPIAFFFMISSCGSKSDEASAKQKELELKAKELELKEKELQLKKSSEESSSKDDISEENKSIESQTNVNNPAPQPRKKTEEDLRRELYKKEGSNPEKYLSLDYTGRVNLLSNTIIKGTVYNSATITGFKNINITLSFYSKTDAYLGSETFTIMDFIQPGQSQSFKYKIEGYWKGAVSVKDRINYATPY
jgi:hypothetical protein